MPKRSRTLYWFRIFVLAMYFILSLAGAAISVAEEGPAPQPAPQLPPQLPPGTTLIPSTEPAPGDKNPSKKTGIGKTLDETHERLERGILNQAIRLDNFFGNVKAEQQEKVEYKLQWRNSLRIDKDGHLQFGTTARANVVLSRISERLRLVISGGDTPAPTAPLLPEDPGNPGFDRTSQSTRLINTELRYGLLHTPSMDLFLGAGVRLIIPPEAFVRSRFAYTYHIDDVSLLSFGETLFVKNPVGPGETTEVSLERSLNPKTILRWSNAGTISYEISGMEWGTELSLIRELSSKSAVTLTGGVYGNTSIEDWVTNYRILARYRRNFLRSWLFYEIEPEMSWPRTAEGFFPTNFAVTFRIEIQFQGAAVREAVKKEAP